MELNAGIVEKLLSDWKDKSSGNGADIKAKWLSTLEADIDLTPDDGSHAKTAMKGEANIAPMSNESVPPSISQLHSGLAKEAIAPASWATSTSIISHAPVMQLPVDRGDTGIRAKTAEIVTGMRQLPNLDERQSAGRENRLVMARAKEYVSQLLGELYPATNIHITKNGEKLVVWIRDYKQQHKQALLDLSKVIVETLGCDEDQLSFMFNGKPLHEDKDSLSAVTARNTFNQE
ncbi:hypothetical protein HCH_04073 [Hahella chejuensis KCTC 2396]|uniref:Uncharacterized protein n=1 Tax=Hahella chejuensis (strain KCTC 2396) TaxID=349521 RepID=Q2SEY8_HAHCH|nr:hypothetical protein [Hahella chejuensis]ABC30786.1 hypothetical protein HCH_04073 [Hahella chejuensis KCTC 2396]